MLQKVHKFVEIEQYAFNDKWVIEEFREEV
jgi:hypothetical protein